VSSLCAIPFMSAPGQDSAATTVICATRPCYVVVDWSDGGAAPTTVDRRYGAPAELEDRVRLRMKERGMRLADRKADAVLSIMLRPRMKAAMCDVLPGTNTDFSCRAFEDVTLQFDVTDSTTATLKGLRAANRCDNDKTPMDVARYAVYLAGFIEWAIDSNPRKKRPGTKC
ncbi:MAG: hypothetical protein ABI877_23170, partial [Gemmatimonadaceae bacterium]